MSSNESAAYEIMRTLDVDYVLVIFGGVIGYSGDDINKFLWMVRIAEGEHPKDIRVCVKSFDWHSGSVGRVTVVTVRLSEGLTPFRVIRKTLKMALAALLHGVQR